MNSRWLWVAVGLLSAWVVAGCATMGNTRGVSVSVVNVLPTNASLFETSAALTVRVANESAQPLTFAGSSHRLYLNGTYVGRAVSNEPFTLAALSTATQTVTVHLENLALVRKLTQLSQNAAPVLSYRLESQLHAPAGQGFSRVVTIATGELDVGALMQATSRAPTGR